MKKYVIYSVCVGNYDDILQPLVIDNRFDYVLFSNDFEEQQIGVWQVRPIPIPQEISKNDMKRLSRYPKTHPETMLPEYEASLYMDMNIQIKDAYIYERFIELVTKRVEYAGIKHFRHDNIYDHAFDMVNWNLEHDYNMFRICQYIRHHGYTRNGGLNENNIIFRMHTKKMQKVNEEWWRMIVYFSHRDQFSYMYILNKYRIPIEYFLLPPEFARNSKHLNFNFHDKRTNSRKYEKIGLFEKIRKKTCTLSLENECFYKNMYYNLYQSKFPLFLFKIFNAMKNESTIPHRDMYIRGIHR